MFLIGYVISKDNITTEFFWFYLFAVLLHIINLFIVYLYSLFDSFPKKTLCTRPLKLFET